MAPSACLASRPVSSEIVVPPTEISRVCICVFVFVLIPSRPGGAHPRPVRSDLLLLADAQSLDQLRIPVRILALQVIEQAAALPNEFQQPAAGVVIFCVGFEMLCQVVDSLAEKRNLNFGGSGVVLVGLVIADDFSLVILRDCHALLPL